MVPAYTGGLRVPRARPPPPPRLLPARCSLGPAPSASRPPAPPPLSPRPSPPPDNSCAASPRNPRLRPLGAPRRPEKGTLLKGAMARLLG